MTGTEAGLGPEPRSIFYDPWVTFVVAEGIELGETDDGRTIAGHVNGDVIVGQIGIGVPPSQNKTSLFPGTTSAREWKRLAETTNGEVSAMIGALVMTPESPPTTFGDRLRRAMLTRRMTVDELASKSGLNQSSIHRWLKSSDPQAPNPKMDTIIALVTALRVDGWWLERGEGEPPHGDDDRTYHEGRT